MRLIFRLLAVGLLIGAFALPIKAAEFRSEKESSIIVKETETPKDLHLAGMNITTDAKVRGDLLIVGKTILSNGEIENSLFIAGGTVTVRSHVLRHVRIAGGTVTLSGKVDGDVFIAGGDVTITDSAEIMGGLYAVGSTLNIAGKINGELRVGGGTVVIDGSVGSARVYGDVIRLTSKAKINGNFNYQSNQMATIDGSAVITGQTNYTKYQTSQFDKYGFLFGTAFTLGYLLRIIGAILLGWLLISFWPRTSRKLIDFAFSSPLPSIGYGLLTLIGVLFTVMILFFTIVGTGVASMLFALWLVALMVGSIFGKILLGSWLYRMFKREAGYQLNVGTVSLGVVAGSILIFIPVIGPFVVFVLFLLGVGSIFNLIIHSRETV